MVRIYTKVQMMCIFQKNLKQSLSRKLFISVNITQDDKALPRFPSPHELLRVIP